MTRQITFWLHQFGSSALRDYTDYDRVCDHLLRLRPDGFDTVGFMPKAHSGGNWQGDFDSHQLAINEHSLPALKGACDARGIALGVWGEPRDDAYLSGTAAGRASAVTGYYCADVEPYSDFKIPNRDSGYTAASVASFAVDFWYQYFRNGGASNPGISVAPQPSGMQPWGWEGTLAWFAPVTWLQPQCYYSPTTWQLNPQTAIPYVQSCLGRVSLRKDFKVLPIFTWANYREEAATDHWPEGLDVWAL